MVMILHILIGILEWWNHLLSALDVSDIFNYNKASNRYELIISIRDVW